MKLQTIEDLLITALLITFNGSIYFVLYNMEDISREKIMFLSIIGILIIIAGVSIVHMFRIVIQNMIDEKYGNILNLYENFESIVSRTVQSQLSHYSTLPEFHSVKGALGVQMVEILSHVVQEALDNRMTENYKEVKEG